jgi:hypothetical protein
MPITMGFELAPLPPLELADELEPQAARRAPADAATPSVLKSRLLPTFDRILRFLLFPCN